MSVYARATGDVNLKQVIPIRSTISVYGGTSIPIIGKVIIRVWRSSKSYKLECKLIESERVRPLLGRKACLGMNVIRYLDNDLLYTPPARKGQVYTVTEGLHCQPACLDNLIAFFPQVFADGPGTLTGYHHIKTDPKVAPVQHAPRRVPVPIREKLRRLLDEMTAQEIIAPVVQPTEWVNSLVVVMKKNKELRICLDPKDLNRAIQREIYPIPTIEDIATRLHTGRKYFLLWMCVPDFGMCN